jgi:hypothetical protein
MSKYTNGSGRSTTPTEISGIAVTRQKRTKKQRAALAASIERGETRLKSLTQAQIARICGVSAAYVHQMQLADRPPVQLAAE